MVDNRKFGPGDYVVCTHWHEGTQWCNEHSYFVDSDGEPCHPSESPNWKMFEPDYYCGSGERKDEKVDS